MTNLAKEISPAFLANGVTMKTSKTITILVALAFVFIASISAAFAAPAKATTAVNVRSGPSTSFSVIGVLLTGQTVNVTRCEGSWCYVEKSGPDGWVSGRYLAPIASGGGGSSADAEAIRLFGNIFGAILGAGTTPPAPAAPPPPAPPTVISAAQVDLPLNWSVNLDTGRAGSGSFPGADIAQQGSGAGRVIYRQNGTLLSLGGASQRGYAGCSAASYSSAPLRVSNILGKTICVKTDRGNISEFWFIGQRGTTLGVKYRTWR